MSHWICLRGIFLFATVFFFGCTSIRNENRTTGLFEDDLDVLTHKYQEVKVGKTTIRDLERAGWNFRIQNVERAQGAEALRNILGDNLFQGAGSSPEKLENLFSVLVGYESLVVPYISVTKLDHYRAGRTEHFPKGTEGRIIFLLRDGLVVYKAENLTGVDRSEIDTGFAQGLFDWLERHSGLVKDTAGFIPR